MKDMPEYACEHAVNAWQARDKNRIFVFMVQTFFHIVYIHDFDNFKLVDNIVHLTTAQQHAVHTTEHIPQT